MRKLCEILLKSSIVIIFLFAIWIVAFFVGISVMPWIETDYHVVGTNQTLANGYILKRTNDVITKIEVPNEFPEYNQCFELWFLSTKGKHTLSVKDFSQTIFQNNNSEVKSEKSYLLWDNGSKKETFNIDNYEIEHSDNYSQKKYVFFRTVFDIDKVSDFSINIKTNFYVNEKLNVIDTTLAIEKKHRLTWNKFRVH